MYDMEHLCWTNLPEVCEVCLFAGLFLWHSTWFDDLFICGSSALVWVSTIMDFRCSRSNATADIITACHLDQDGRGDQLVSPFPPSPDSHPVTSQPKSRMRNLYSRSHDAVICLLRCPRGSATAAWLWTSTWAWLAGKKTGSSTTS